MESENTSKNAVLAWISRDDDLVPEMRELCRSAGYEIVSEVRQNKDRPDPKCYLGTGKLEEIGPVDGVEYLVTPTDLSPSQVFSMGRTTGLTVVDRIRVILELFKLRANSPEARLQVEMADLKYQLPIIKEYIHQGTLSERPGFLAGGEYRIDYYYEMVRKRLALIKSELLLHRKRRGNLRNLRRRKGANLIAIAGYTNAGKSTLLNSIIEDRDPLKASDVGPKMFTTIATTTRKMRGGRNCIVTDTVGFIRDLPPWMIEGFMSTLEEVFEADVVILVADASDPYEDLRRKIGDSLEVLSKGGTRGKIILALNKCDLLNGPADALIEKVRGGFPASRAGMIANYVPISAVNGEGIQLLVDTVSSLLAPQVTIRISLPLDEKGQKELSQLRKDHGPFEVSYLDGRASFTVVFEERWARSVEKAVIGAEGTFEVL